MARYSNQEIYYIRFMLIIFQDAILIIRCGLQGYKDLYSSTVNPHFLKHLLPRIPHFLRQPFGNYSYMSQYIWT